jgi:hypothetical protein
VGQDASATPVEKIEEPLINNGTNVMEY